jgi:transcriptional regulator with XRE-family HTH domain
VLRECRQGKGLSQEELAEAAELDRSFISLLERGIQSPNLVVLFKIAEVLGIPAAEIVARAEAVMQNPRRK